MGTFESSLGTPCCLAKTEALLRTQISPRHLPTHWVLPEAASHALPGHLWITDRASPQGSAFYRNGDWLCLGQGSENTHLHTHRKILGHFPAHPTDNLPPLAGSGGHDGTTMEQTFSCSCGYLLTAGHPLLHTTWSLSWHAQINPFPLNASLHACIAWVHSTDRFPHTPGREREGTGLSVCVPVCVCGLL